MYSALLIDITFTSDWLFARPFVLSTMVLVTLSDTDLISSEFVWNGTNILVSVWKRKMKMNANMNMTTPAIKSRLICPWVSQKGKKLCFLLQSDLRLDVVLFITIISNSYQIL